MKPVHENNNETEKIANKKLLSKALRDREKELFTKKIKEKREKREEYVTKKFEETT